MCNINKVVLWFLSASVILSGCKGGGDETAKTEARGGVQYGGVFRINEEEDFRNLYPLRVTEVVSHRISNQLYEGLVDLDQRDLSIRPSLAEKWEVNEGATSFTFHLRKGVMFHDDPCFPDGKGREVKAQDFKYSFTKICENDPMNAGFWVFKGKVKGADAYYQSTIDGKPLAEGVTGITVVDDYTIRIDLEYSFAGFINVLAHPFTCVFPKEAVDKYGVEMRVKAVGTGPFKIKEVKEGDVVILVKNENYWGVDQYGNKLPYLDAIKFTFVKEKKAEFLEFKKQNLDMVFRLPVEMIDEILGELENAKGNLGYDLQITPALSVQYYGFLHSAPVFRDVRVRKAFNHAIDRKKIINYTLRGEGIPGTYGFVPPSFRRSGGEEDFRGYNAENIRGYDYNPDLARQYLSEAGYPNGKKFPTLTLQLNSGGSRNIQVAEVIQNMLSENLGININLNVMPFAQHLENVESAKAKFWRAGWIADYPDPENFLNLLYGPNAPASLQEKSYINTFRFKNARYDSLFAAALREVDEKKRFALYEQADQIIMEEAAVMVIYYDENYRLLQRYVKNFPINPMEYRKLTDVYFDRGEEKPKKK